MPPSQSQAAAEPRRARHPLGAPALLFGVLAAPLAWFLQIAIVEALAAQSCFAYDKPLPQPRLHGALTTSAVVAAVCLIMGVCGAALAWRNRRIAATVAREAGARSDHVLLRRVAFITHASLMSTLLFVLILVVTDVAGLIVSPCGRW
ncbi:hypothetical protein FAZ95_13055 [Trinickia violacea]|uniref:Uncharacterized protein n=1 Tax=Trinickia violacea TaxID=2571746 RepID=A0A4P8IM63_9BURK|nr:hypothetical protein [Trinickia violacea]QCP50028.1 hypothetical protein FAZ95_13055 [Trinickia violacea]